MKRIALFLFLWITGLAALYAAEPETIEPGDIDALTNALKIADSTVYLKPGEYDLSALTNAPMYAPGYYGASLLTVASGCKIVGMSDNPADVVLKGGNRFRIFRTNGENVGFYNLTIAGGDTTDEVDGNGTTVTKYKSGGGIFAFHSGCIVSNCVFEGNRAQSHGAAIGGNENFNATLYNCTLRSNCNGYSGGVAHSVVMHWCHVTNNLANGSNYAMDSCRAYDCVIADNTVNYSAMNAGVAVRCRFLNNKSLQYNNGSGASRDTVATNCYYFGNSSPRYGGAVRGGTLYGCTMVSNTASSIGGAAYNVDRVEGCTFIGNKASLGGGVAECSNVSNCVFSGNSATSNGGGLYLSSEIYDCTVVSNTAINGGGFYCCTNVCDSLVVYNYAAENGAGAYNSVVSNCLVDSNVALGYGGGIFGGEAYECGFASNVPFAANNSLRLVGCDVRDSGLYHVNLSDRCRFHDMSNTVSVVNNVQYPDGYAKSTDYLFFGCGDFRNCVFDNILCEGRVDNHNTAVFYYGSSVNTSSLKVDNCTFVSNRWQYTLRGYNSSERQASFANCVFYRNISNTSGSWSDLKGHDSGYVFLANCVMGKNELSRADGVEWVDTSILGTGYEPGFKLKGDDPYAPKRLSMLRGAGTVADWMHEEGAVDFSGNPRIVDGKVDIGAYQYRFEPKGMYLLLK